MPAMPADRSARPPKDAQDRVGLAIAATVGGAAALSWSLWVLAAFGAAP